MNKHWALVGSSVCGLMLAVAGCASTAPKGSGQPSGGGGTGVVQAGASGNLGSAGFGNGGTGVVGGTSGMITLPDGGTGPVGDPNQVFTQDDTGMAMLDQPTLDALRKGGGSCTANIVYPYKDTVFPRGLPSPEIMWTGTADAAYVHVTYANQANVDYQFAVKGAASLKIPQDAWNKIVARSKTAPLIINLNTKSGGAISSCQTNWTIAPGTLTGAVYYNTYNAPGAMFPNQGAVMRLTLGKDMSDVYLQDTSPKNNIAGTGPCISCHSLSFDGSMLVASRHDYGGNGASKVFKFEVSAYPVTTNLQPMAQPAKMNNGNFGGLYPNGKRILTMGNPQCTNGAETFPRAPNNFMMVPGPNVAETLDPATGMQVPANGLNKDWYMWMPQFSPDGKKVVFNHAKPDGKGGTDRRELAVMDYDYATNTFSNLKVIASKLGPDPNVNYAPGPTLAGTLTDSCQPALAGTDQTASLANGACSGPCYPGWPFFTPDGKGVVFLLIDQPDFASAFPGRNQISKGELWYADIASGKTVRLDKANKGPMAGDELTSYYPTMMPVALGGYYWLFFTSKRNYGTKVYPDLPQSSTYFLSTGPAEDDAKTKRIWVSALRPVGDSTEFMNGVSDISNPAFFLDGQSVSGNVRAFTTLNPCTKSGDTSTCTSGLDCCSGYCFIPPDQANQEFDKTPVGHCTDMAPACSKTNERCNKDADCCPPAAGQPKNTCIGGFCTFITVVQ